MSGKRWAALIGAVAISALLVVGAGGVRQVGAPAGPWQERTLEGGGFDKVAVIRVSGEIVAEGQQGPFGGGPASAADLVSQLRQAQEDEAVKAVIVHLNTPGGSVVGSDSVLRAVEELSEAGKPVVASMGEIAASGGYYIAAGADRIVADPATLTGSIGVIMVLMNFEDAAGKLGIEPIVIKAGRHKDMGSPFRDLSGEERRMFEDLLEESHERFIGIVAEGRNLDGDELEDVTDGRIMSGLQAEERGLVDVLGGFSAAIDEAKALAELDDALVVEYHPQLTFAGALLGIRNAISPVEQVKSSLGITGPRLAYLYLP
jgi:protease-4